MPRVAEEVLAYCSSCRLDLGAVIVAMKGDQILRVQCKTCRGERAYKSPKGVTDPSKAPPPKTQARSARTDTGEKIDHSVAAEWRKLMNQYKQNPANPYSAKAPLAIHDRVKHPTFGEGVVLKHIFPNKAEIIFEMDVKTLICGGAKT
jgi:hypothetical protein